jgi:hypothetical protein
MNGSQHGVLTRTIDLVPPVTGALTAVTMRVAALVAAVSLGIGIPELVARQFEADGVGLSARDAGNAAPRACLQHSSDCRAMACAQGCASGRLP